MSEVTKQALKGGEFVIKDVEVEDIFTPEQFDEEQLMISQTCKDYVATEVHPRIEEIEKLPEGLNTQLMEKAGELGILGVHIPEQYGGFGKGTVTDMLVAESIGHAYSMTVSMMAHTGIGTLPILYYGNDAQKEKYIPKLASGEWKAAYCLTEPASGSDANSGKTSAKLSEDGKHWILNGQKMWITNAGFADVFTVFAKIDDDKNLSAFIVEKGAEGLSLNAEEQKMGIKGSSTRQVFFNNCKIPVENQLGEREIGFKIALNILNIGRIKLGAGVMGACKETINNAVNYTNEREQFGRLISKYGAIRHKLAEQCVKTYSLESAVYRAAHDIDNKIAEFKAEGMDPIKAKMKASEEFAIECALLKVLGSEVLDYVVDEGVQIYGGMGYSAEAPMDRSYRDARINRIFEGSNEINRMLMVDMILKKGLKGQLDLMGPAQQVAGELMSVPSSDDSDGGLFATQKKLVKNFKKAGLMVAGAAVQKLMQTLSKEQEVLMNISDILIIAYTAESTLLRTEKLVGIKGEAAVQEQIDMMNTYLYDAADKVNKYGKDAINSFADGDEQRMMLMGLKRFTKTEPFNVKEARQRIAAKLIDANKYCY